MFIFNFWQVECLQKKKVMKFNKNSTKNMFSKKWQVIHFTVFHFTCF